MSEDWKEIDDVEKPCSDSNGWCGWCGRCREHSEDYTKDILGETTNESV